MTMHHAQSPSNTFGMNWNEDCEPDLTIDFLADWKQVPTVKSLPRGVENVIAAKRVPIHINARDFGMRSSTTRCPHTFGHVVYHEIADLQTEIKMFEVRFCSSFL
jgi:hypothetical protein